MKEFETQICTTIEQSKRLLDLGLESETADMCWFNDMQKPFCAPYKCFVEKAQDMKWVISPAWSLHRLIELYKDVEDTSMWSLENVNYNRLIQCISLAIKHGTFNKEYLKQ